MKRRKPILEFQNPRDPPARISKNTSAIQSLVCYSEDSDTESNISGSKTNISTSPKLDQSGKPTTPWQACMDENTGYSYYWNMETNQVTWEVPAEYLVYESLVQQWEMQQAANTAKYEELSEIQQKTEKKPLIPINHNSSSDSDSSVKDEKIELITTYGPSSDDSDSERKNSRKVNIKNHDIGKSKTNPIYNGKFIQSTNPSSPKLPSVTSSIPSHEINKGSSFVNSQSETRLGEKNSSPNLNQLVEQMNEMKDNNKSPSNNGSLFNFPKEIPSCIISGATKPSLAFNKENSDENSSDENEDEDDEELDDVIISRLRKKATLLKQLGGEVPKEILSVFDNSKTAEDIIAEIEREIPADRINSDNMLFKKPKLPEIPNIEEKPSEILPVKPLFPILDYMKKEPQVEAKAPTKSFVNQKNKMKNIQKIKLSARAKELIRTSLLTAKARATNFVETEDGLKPAEEVQKLETKENSSENTVEDNKLKLDPDEAAELADFTPLPKKPADAPSVIEDLELKQSAPAANYFNLPDNSKGKEEKKGLSFKTKVEEVITIRRNDTNFFKSDSSNDAKFDFQQSFMVYYPKDKKPDDSKKTDDLGNASLWSKCEEFLKTEINRPDDTISADKDKSKRSDDRSKHKNKTKENQDTFSDIDIDAVLNTKDENEDKKMSDLSQLIMEKLKFLSEGKGSVAPVQVMAIQIETLVGAWHTGALNLKYLSEWLDASLVQLKSIEESAAPNGWHCEWDRSYGRYYYRNKVTGSIQWDFPEYDDNRKSSSKSSKRSSCRKSSHSRPKTPPPPVISDMVPPPPPVISDRDRDRKRRPSPRRDSDKRRRNEDRYISRSSKSRHGRSPPSSAPVLPPLPPKPATPPPPPPPPSSPPPPPPPPPTISSTVEIGPTFSENNYTDACTTVTPMEIENDDEKPVKLHDELDSFYSDIASIEATFVQDSKTEHIAKTEEPTVLAPKPQLILGTSVNQDKPAKTEEKVVKKKKKVKLDSGLSLKKKGLEGLVAKWQKVNSDI